jgi:short-subunit dehydrogenase
MSRQLTGKTILITGASSGIGAATAVQCAEAGMDVVLGARRMDRLSEVATAVERTGRGAVKAACDVTDPDQVAELCHRGFQTFGRLDAVFANAGYGMYGSVLRTPMADHRAIFEVNYFGTLHILQAAEDFLRQTEGGLKHVLVCSSAASEIGFPMYGAYAATKAAQDAIAGAMRGEMAEAGLTVTTVHPVGTRTEFFETVRSRSPRTGERPAAKGNTPAMFTQDVETVARRILGALRRPKPELWPMRSARWGLALCSAFPRLGELLVRRHYRRIAAD